MKSARKFYRLFASFAPQTNAYLFVIQAGLGWTMRSFGPALFACSMAVTTQAATPPVVNRITAGEFIIDPPTLINLGFEWVIKGDDNRNAKVEVSYRKKGETVWKQAMPLMRMQHERIYWGAEKADDHVINVILPNTSTELITRWTCG